MNGWRKSPWVIDHTPLLAVALLEWANVSQLVRMWTEHSADGQSIMGWLSVNVALWLWLNFYLVVTPDKKWAIRGTAFGIAMNGAVVLSVAWFRWLA